MAKVEILPVERGRSWLPIRYSGREVKVAYPPVQGTHEQCFQAINKDPELRPAEGLELALITAGAYNGIEPEWQSIRQNCFVSNYTRVPIRNLWIPKNTFKEDKSLSGVLVERDVKGKGLSTKMQVPDLSDSTNWQQNDSGIYISKDKNKTFIPSDKYKLGEHTQKSFAKDGYAITVLTPEGAELFAKTAYDAGKTPWIWGINVSDISDPEQRVSLLYEDVGRLDLGGYVWYDVRNYRAFGVFSKTGGASLNFSQKT
jgi:hypothetical protein